MREAVHVEAVDAFAESLGVLVAGVPQLARLPARQPRHVHPVIVDQAQGQLPLVAGGDQQHVAVLQVGMGDLGLAQARG